MVMKAFTIEQKLSGNAIILVITPAKDCRIGSYGNYRVKKGSLEVVISMDKLKTQTT